MKWTDCMVRFHGAEFQAKDIRSMHMELGALNFSIVEHIHGKSGELLFSRSAEYKVMPDDVEIVEA